MLSFMPIVYLPAWSRRLWVPAVLGLAVVGWSAGPAAAQSLFGTGSTTNRLGGTGFGTAGSGASVGRPTVGGAGFGGPAMGAGGMGAGGMGAGGMGAGGFGGGMAGGMGAAGGTGVGTGQIGLNTQLGQVSGTIGQGPFVGGSDNMGRFVGERLTGQTGMAGATGIGGMGGIGAMGGIGGIGPMGPPGGMNPNQQFNQGRGGFVNGPAQRRPIRPRQRVAFEYTPRTESQVEQSVTTVVRSLQTRRPGLNGVTIELTDDRTAVLRGTVDSDDDRKLAAALARLEPGVRSIRNELQVDAE